MGVGVSALFEYQCHLRAGGDAVAGLLLVFRLHLVLLQNRVTRVVKREQVGIDGIALGMAGALGVVNTDAHSQKMILVIMSATAAGLSEPSSSTVFRMVRLTMPSATLVTSSSSERTRTRLPTATGARKRTLFSP